MDRLMLATETPSVATLVNDLLGDAASDVGDVVVASIPKLAMAWLGFVMLRTGWRLLGQFMYDHGRTQFGRRF